MKGRHKFKDDDPVEPFDYQKFQLNNEHINYTLAQQLQFTMKPMQEIIQAKSQGKQIIPFVCSLKANEIVIPDNV